MTSAAHQHVRLSAVAYSTLLAVLGEQLAFHEDRLSRLEAMRTRRAALVDPQDLEDARLRVEELIDAVTVLADALVGADPVLRTQLSAVWTSETRPGHADDGA